MSSVRSTLRDPVFWTDASQIVKTVAAAVLAWALAYHVFGLAQPFLAPWAALLTVHATVYRTLARGAQQVGATVLGVLLAFVVGNLLGVNAVSLALMLLVAMLAGSSRGLRDESTTAAATALVVLLTGYSSNDNLLGARLLDTVIGIGVGLVVNLVVWPPLRDRSAARRVDRIDDELGELLSDMAARLREGGDADDVGDWVGRTRDLDHEIDAAWATIRQARESGRLNLRAHAGARMRRSEAFGDVLGRLEQAVAETRSMAWTITRADSSVDDDFRALWADLLGRAGAAVSAADSVAIGEVAAEVAAAGEGDHRPARGALLVNLRNILEAMGTVADAQPVRADVRHLALS
jgi:uncharacterized membrane protein YccC